MFSLFQFYFPIGKSFPIKSRERFWVVLTLLFPFCKLPFCSITSLDLIWSVSVGFMFKNLLPHVLYSVGLNLELDIHRVNIPIVF